MKEWPKILVTGLATAAVLSLQLLYASAATPAMAAKTPVAAPKATTVASPAPKAVKSVIMMIPDGMSVAATTLSRYYKDPTGKTPLALDMMASGLVRTQWAAGMITDSAPAATAFSTGFKADDGMIGVLPAAQGSAPVANLLEAARLAGKSTGLIATSEIMHATPADFAGHDTSRSNYDNLGEQLVYNNVDVILGAGDSFLSDTARKDRENMNDVLKAKGYDVFSTIAQLKASTSSKIWGSFSATSLAYEMDRDPSKEPSLAEMTKKAIDVLSRDPDGFFLMVEGSKVDWAAHANDTIGIISDTLAFDAAVKVAYDFAKGSGDVAIVCSTDHGNSGISIGSSSTSSNYNKRPVSDFIDPLKKAKLTLEGTLSKFNTMLLPDRSNLASLAGTWYGLTDLTAEEIAALTAAPKVSNMGPLMAAMLSKRANIGYTTNGHTGEDVVLYSWSTDGDRLIGVVDNTDLAKYMARKLGVDLATTTKKLFVDAVKAFTAKGAKAEVIVDKLYGNHLLVVTKGMNTLYVPVNKNEAFINDRAVTLPGVAVYSANVFYVSQDAVDLIP